MSTEYSELHRQRLVGLSEAEVQQSRSQHGPNVLTPPKRTPIWKLYLDKYSDPIIQILLVAAAISLGLAFFTHDFIETIGIILAVVFATTVGFYFEVDAQKKFSVLNAMEEEQPVKVLREGHVMKVARKDLVVGDIVLLETGDEVPADGTLLESTDLQVDESSLTGEPLATKHADATKDPGGQAYAANRMLRSSMVMNGRAVMRVTEVGDETEIGKVARSATSETGVKTPLSLQLDRLAKLISKVGGGISVAAFFAFLLRDILTNPVLWHSADYLGMAEAVLKYFMMAVTLIVMAVPEGLPMAVTLALALNMRRMLKSNNLVRKLHSCETMGAVTVICTDKTGTLTQNRMTVGDIQFLGDRDLLLKAIALNSTASLDRNGNGVGNPTEAALIAWAKDADVVQLREQYPVEDVKPFSTELKYMATVVSIDGRRYLFIKGAPEIVAGFCSLPPAELENNREWLRAHQQKAMRTLAFAYKALNDEDIDTALRQGGLCWQAMVALSDPVRPDVAEAVDRCRKAGVKVKVVTGDTAATALQIAKEIGICNDDDNLGEVIITGDEWQRLSDDEARQRARKIKVMARARPTDKQRLVQLLQQQGEVVAVTGDGTNDAPALNYAHVGLSLGSGTSVAKEASDMTLLDDSFATIANALMWGRSLYKNIQRFLFFQLVVNVTALLLVLGGAFIGSELPLTVTQILWVNLIMDTFAAMALASLPPSREVMREKPRKAGDFIISRGMGKAILFCGLVFSAFLFVLLWHSEHDSEPGIQVHELTIFFTTFVMVQVWNLFNAKSLGSCHSAFRRIYADSGLLFVLLLVLLGQWLIVTFGGAVFRTVPLTAKEWLMIILATSPVLIFGELWRGLKRLRQR